MARFAMIFELEWRDAVLKNVRKGDESTLLTDYISSILNACFLIFDTKYRL